jgi:hypothetical protein
MLFHVSRRFGATLVATAAIALGACSDDDDSAAPIVPEPEPTNSVALANHSVTPALIKSLPSGVTAYSLLSSDDALAASPAFMFGGSADGAGLLKNPDGTYTYVTNHEDNFSVSRITLDATFKPVRGEYILNSTNGRWRLCSASLATPAEHGYGPVFITVGESNIESQIHAVDPYGAPNSSTILNALGRWNSENALPLPKTAFAGKTVVVIGDDDSGVNGGQVAMYVGNGVGNLTGGSLYVMARANDNTRERDMVTGQTYPVEFRQIPNAAALTGAQIEQAGVAVNMLQLGRTEDLDYRKSGGQGGREIYFVTTGQNNTGINANYDRSKYGRIYRLILDANDPLKGSLEVVVDGDDRTQNNPAAQLQNPDNITVASNYVYFKEDPNGYGDETHDARIYQYNIATKAITVVGELDHRRTTSDAAKYNASGTSDFGDWEFGAMIDISDLVGVADTWMLNIQPHTWRGTQYRNPDGGTIRPNENQASQVIILKGLPR